MEKETKEVFDAEPSSRKMPGDGKYHFLVKREHPTEKRLVDEHIGAAWGRTAEQAREEMFEAYREYGHTRPIEMWEEAIETTVIKQDPETDNPPKQMIDSPGL